MRAGSAPQDLEVTGDTILGMIENLTFRTCTAMLEPGDAIFLYTDGVTEAMDAQRKLFSEARLEAYLRQAGELPTEQIIRGVVDAVRAFAGGAAQSDDLTAMAARFLGRPRDGKAK